MRKSFEIISTIAIGVAAVKTPFEGEHLDSMIIDQGERTTHRLSKGKAVNKYKSIINREEFSTKKSAMTRVQSFLFGRSAQEIKLEQAMKDYND